MKVTWVALFSGIAALLASSAHASTVTIFQGQDDGAGAGQALATYVNSNAAFNSFNAAAMLYGPTEVHGFGSATDGFHNITWMMPSGAGTLSYTSTSTDFGNQYSGVNSTTLGNVYGFGVGVLNTKWLGILSGTATFNFSGPIYSFGLWLTGIQGQQTGTNIQFQFTDADGMLQTLSPNYNENGGAQFFGFTDTAAFSIITLSVTGNDAWGIDNVIFNTPAAVPIPAALPLFATGLGVLGFAGWRRKRKTALAAA